MITQTGFRFVIKDSIYRLLEKLMDNEIIGSSTEDEMAMKVRKYLRLSKNIKFEYF